MSSAYIMCMLGSSPSILTNLLWWLATRERCAVAGIEVWVPRSGGDLLLELVASDGWRELQQHTGPLPSPELCEEPAHSYGFRVHHHRLASRVLDDVRTAEEAGAVNAALHDRVRALRHGLPADIQLLGCLAGGRKTVSAALQTAFCLQARAADRLVHVVLDERFEQVLRRAGEPYTFPTPAWAERSGVPMSEQIVVYDVPYPHLQRLVPPRLRDALESTWDEVWPALEANTARETTGRLVRRGETRWTYEVVDGATGEVLFTAALAARPGATLAALAHATPGSTTYDLVTWLDAHEMGWTPPAARGAGADELRAAPIRSALTKLREKLRELPVGLEAFVPAKGQRAMPHIVVVDERPATAHQCDAMHTSPMP